MSVRFHEAFCLDSARKRFEFNDHFLGDSIRDLWSFNIGGASTLSVIDAQNGGVARITTGALTGNYGYLQWGNIRSLLVSKKVTIEYRIKINDISNIDFEVGLVNVWNDIIRFYLVGNDLHIYTRVIAGGITDLDSGIDVDTDYHRFRIECLPAGEAYFYIDGVQCANSPITTNTTTNHLQPWVYLDTNENVAKSMDINYVVIRQDR